MQSTWNVEEAGFVYRNFENRTVKIEGLPMVIDEKIGYFASRQLDFEVQGQTANRGFIKGYDGAGNLRFDGNYLRNELYGPARTIHTNGTTRDSGMLVMNLPNGEWKFYNPDGSVKSIRNYDAFMWWNIQWSIQTDNPFWNWFAISDVYKKQPSNFFNLVNAAATFNNKYSPPFYYCIQHGKVINYHPNGAVADSITYFKGMPDGLWMAYYDNGVLKEKGAYNVGEKIGTWKMQYPSGNLASLKIYRKGNLIESKDFID